MLGCFHHQRVRGEKPRQLSPTPTTIGRGNRYQTTLVTSATAGDPFPLRLFFAECTELKLAPLNGPPKTFSLALTVIVSWNRINETDCKSTK